jgi:GT2 family glycosyltransferase
MDELAASDERPGASIALVVATYRRPDALITLLRALARQTLPPACFEVAVVVDGRDESESRYREVLEEARRSAPYSLRFAFQDNAGPSVARHRAIGLTTAPWICVVDDDMDLSPGFLAAHVEALGIGPDSTVVLGRVVPEEGWQRAPLYEAVRTMSMLELHEALAGGARPPSGYALVTQNVSFPRAVFEKVGGFDPHLRLGEDIELGLRLEFAGCRFVFSDAASAIHRSRVGAYRTWLDRCVAYGASNVYIHRKFDGDPRTHPLRNLVRGSRMNAAAVHAVCWWDPLAFAGISGLHGVGIALQRAGAFGPAIATHKAILAIAYHVGVKRALGSWSALLRAKSDFAAAPDAPVDPT